MSRSSSKLSIPAAVTVGAVAVIALIASGVLRPAPVTGANPSPSPSAPVNPAPSAPAPTPRPPASPAPTQPPVDDPVDGEKFVQLDVADPNRVIIGVKDFTGQLVDATSGRAGDGMSVRWSELKVVNLDDDTLRLTWVGLPNDDPIKVVIAHFDGDPDGTPSIVLFRLEPPANSDALGYDRVLDLHFGAPVRAEDFNVAVQDGMDT